MQPIPTRQIPLLPVIAGALILIPFLIVAGCTGQAPGIHVEGTSWTLAGYVYNGTPVQPLSGTRVTLDFGNDGGISGSAGCNRYFASSEIRGTAITIGRAGSTLMYCSDPGVMDQEAAYLALLGQATSISADSERLTLMDGKGTAILTFARVVPPAPAPLAGTPWTLSSIHAADAVSSVIAGTSITALFGDDGQISGSGGCNRYFASYTLKGTAITVGPAGSTEMYCGAQGVMDQESMYLNHLGQAKTVSLTGDTLTLSDAAGRALLTYTKTLPPPPAPLAGTPWTLSSFHAGDTVSSVQAGTAITALFGGDGSVSGSAGCNRYFASYTVTGTSLVIGQVGSTKMHCGAGGVMQQESTYLASLGKAAKFTITGNQLTLADAQGAPLLSFVKES